MLIIAKLYDFGQLVLTSDNLDFKKFEANKMKLEVFFSNSF